MRGCSLRKATGCHLRMMHKSKESNGVHRRCWRRPPLWELVCILRSERSGRNLNHDTTGGVLAWLFVSEFLKGSLKHREGIFGFCARMMKDNQGLVEGYFGAFGSSPNPILHSYYNMNPRRHMSSGLEHTRTFCHI